MTTFSKVDLQQRRTNQALHITLFNISTGTLVLMNMGICKKRIVD